MPEITASLIVRDEEAYLDGCLAALSDHVDEIVVVDTGSVDSSRELARHWGARVLEFAWTDDFAAARNVGLEAASGDWILYIDADERLSVPAGSKLRDGLDQPNISAATVGFRPRIRMTPYREVRLFRNDPRIRFRGVIHETMRPALAELHEAMGASIAESVGSITHLGYEGDQGRKNRRNLPLLLAAVETDPQRLFYWNHLAEVLADLGRPAEALETCLRGMTVMRRSTGRDNPSASLLALTFGRLLREQGDDPMPIIEEGLRFHPDNKALLFLKARCLVDDGEYAAGLAILDGLTRVDATTFCDPDAAYDKRIFGSHAFDLAGVALLRLGRVAEAAIAFARAAEAESDEPSFRIKAAAFGPRLINPAA